MLNCCGFFIFSFRSANNLLNNVTKEEEDMDEKEVERGGWKIHVKIEIIFLLKFHSIQRMRAVSVMQMEHGTGTQIMINVSMSSKMLPMEWI